MTTPLRTGLAGFGGGAVSRAHAATLASVSVTIKARTMADILHILYGDAPRPAMEQASVPGTLSAWPDVLHDGPTPLATGEEWIRARCGYLDSIVPVEADELAEHYRASDAVLESWRERDEVVFWFEHDLFDQLLLIRHL